MKLLIEKENTQKLLKSEKHINNNNNEEDTNKIIKFLIRKSSVISNIKTISKKCTLEILKKYFQKNRKINIKKYIKFFKHKKDI